MIGEGLDWIYNEGTKPYNPNSGKRYCLADQKRKSQGFVFFTGEEQSDLTLSTVVKAGRDNLHRYSSY
ncbi:hypothetical protein NL676_018686 [Syzygium grande]|nr:hypothetical protein NL676_018686 [Syzygium grande]